MATIKSLYLQAETNFDYEALEMFRQQLAIIDDLKKRVEELEVKLAAKLDKTSPQSS